MRRASRWGSCRAWSSLSRKLVGLAYLVEPTVGPVVGVSTGLPAFVEGVDSSAQFLHLGACIGEADSAGAPFEEPARRTRSPRHASFVASAWVSRSTRSRRPCRYGRSATSA